MWYVPLHKGSGVMWYVPLHKGSGGNVVNAMCIYSLGQLDVL